MKSLILKALVGTLSGLLFQIAAAASQATSDTGVYVEFRESDLPDAPVVDRWRLYGASHALVIGIDNYSEGWPRLSNAIKDAKLVADELRQQGFDVVLLTDVTGTQLRESLRRFFAFKGKDPQARLFVWFAGHGHTKNGEGYLVPADAPLPGSPEFNYTALHMGDVGSMVRIAESKHVLAVFDSCFAGTIFGSQRSRPPTAITAAVKRPVRQFLTSGDAEQKVSDDGTFRTLFLRALKGEEMADANRDGYLTGTELSFYLEDRVINLSQGIQTPRGGKLRDPKFDQGDFVFLLPKAPAAPLAETVATLAVAGSNETSQQTLDLTFWKSIEDSDNPAALEAYLERFPDGTFSGLAQVKLAEIRRQQKIAALPPPPAPVPEIANPKTDEKNQIRYALKTSNVRAGPGTEYAKIGRLQPGDRVDVKEMPESGDWYRVGLFDGRQGFVFGKLLGTSAPRMADEPARRQAASTVPQTVGEALAQAQKTYFYGCWETVWANGSGSRELCLWSDRATQVNQYFDTQDASNNQTCRNEGAWWIAESRLVIQLSPKERGCNTGQYALRGEIDCEVGGQATLSCTLRDIEDNGKLRNELSRTFSRT